MIRAGLRAADTEKEPDQTQESLAAETSPANRLGETKLR